MIPRRGALLAVPFLAAVPWVARAAPRPVERPAERPPAPASRLPQPLGASEAARYRRIFTLQAEGALAAARDEDGRLEDRRLIGHVLADRWLARRLETPAAPALAQFLARHGDHPDAAAIRRLAEGGTASAAPEEARELVPEEREARPLPRDAALERTVRERAMAGDTGGALALIARAGAHPAYAQRLRAEAAFALFRAGHEEAAFGIASDVARAGTETAGRAAFAAGLSAWGLERFDVALPYFEVAARAQGASASQRSAAAYWTARAAVRARRPALHTPWLLQAAQEPRSFHGLLARRALGLAADFAWDSEPVAAIDATTLGETAGGWRALALLQIGQGERAAAELRHLAQAAEGNAALARAMLGLAREAGMTQLAARLAGLAQSADGRPRDFARFPMPRLEPLQGYRVDPSLVYAVARQESNFDPAAISRAGARGLMQIMPATARYVAGDAALGAEGLHDPRLSLELAQRYMVYLARHDAVRGDLLRLLAAYNAGPGNVARWAVPERRRQDPLLVIESIPIEETRLYVPRVLAYSWIYASRLGLVPASLDALARGEAPRFAGVEEVTAMLRASPRRAAAP